LRELVTEWNTFNVYIHAVPYTCKTSYTKTHSQIGSENLHS